MTSRFTSPRPLFLFLGVLVLMVAGAVLAANVSANNAHNPNIRGSDGKLTAQRLSTSPQLCEFYIADGTGETLATPSDTVVTSATLGHISAVRGSAVGSDTGGTCKVARPGLYRVDACITSGTGANTAVHTLKIFRKDGAGAAAELSPAIRGVGTTLTAHPTFSLCPSVFVPVTPAEAAATGGVVFDGRLTSSTGNAAVLSYRLRVEKVDDIDGGAYP